MLSRAEPISVHNCIVGILFTISHIFKLPTVFQMSLGKMLLAAGNCIEIVQNWNNNVNLKTTLCVNIGLFQADLGLIDVNLESVTVFCRTF